MPRNHRATSFRDAQAHIATTKRTIYDKQRGLGSNSVETFLRRYKILYHERGYSSLVFWAQPLGHSMTTLCATGERDRCAVAVGNAFGSARRPRRAVPPYR